MEQMNVPYSWTSTSTTHVGLVRKNNEDNLLDLSEQGLWVVADGMGGGTAGERASQIVVDAFRDFTRLPTLTENIEDLESRVIKANHKCRSDPRVAHMNQLMGSTVVLLFFWKDKAMALWVGDSRLYRMRKDQFEQLSTDHSLVQEMVEFGHLSKAESEYHPQSNIITRGVGVADEVYVDMEYFSLKEGDKFLLCSDGLNKHCLDYELAQPIKKLSIQKARDKLLQMALDGGGGDNVTIVLVEAGKK